MEALTGVTLAGGGLLIATALPKLRSPQHTVRALRSVGAPKVGSATVRLLAAGELLLGVAVVLTGASVALAAAAVAYLGFSGFVIVALRRDGVVSSCGCTGRSDTPPTYGHLVLTGSFVLGFGIAVPMGAGGLATLSWSEPWPTAGLLLTSMILGWFCWLVLNVAPQLVALRTPTEAT